MNKNKQAGMSGWGTLGVVILLGFFGLIVLKMTPVYLEAFNVQSVIEKLQEDRDALAGSKRDIRETILKRFSINQVRSVNKDHIEIEKSSELIKVTVKYERREGIIANVDAVASFEYGFEKQL